MKFGWKTILATLLIVGSLVGTVSGVWLVRNSEIRQSAAWDCSKYVFSIDSLGRVTVRNDSTRDEPSQEAKVYINGNLVATLSVPALRKGQSAEIGYIALPSGSFQWRIDGTRDCDDSGSITLSPTPTPTDPPSQTPSPTPPQTSTSTPTESPSNPPSEPPITAQCLDVKVFDTDWNRIPSSDFVNIQPGDTVRFTVGGSTTGGSITKARFTINGQLRAEVVGKRPGADEYYDEYTIPQSATGFTVEAQVFHSTLGWF